MRHRRPHLWSGWSRPDPLTWISFAAPTMAAPAVASDTTAIQGGTGTSLTISTPSGTVAGDFLAMFYWYVASASATPKPPTGFSVPTNGSIARQSASSSGSYCATRLCDGTEGSSFTFDITTSGSKFNAYGILIRVTGASAVDVAANQLTTSGSTGNFPSVTTTAANDLVLIGALLSHTPSGAQWPTGAVPTGTTLIDTTQDATNGEYSGVAYFDQATAGATGAKTVAIPTVSTSNDFQALTLAIKPKVATVLTAAFGSIALTGEAARLARGHTLAAGAGELGLTGEAAPLIFTRAIKAAFATFGLDGQPAGLSRGCRLATDAGDIALSGEVAALQLGRRVGAAFGAIGLTGAPAGLARHLIGASEFGAFDLAGQAATLFATHGLLADAAAFALAGQDAALINAREAMLPAQPGAFALGGQAAGLIYRRLFSAAQGTFAETGQVVALRHGRRVPADVGEIAFTGEAATLRLIRALLAAHGDFALSGEAAQLALARGMAAAFGAFLLQGIDAELTGNALVIDPATAILIAPRLTALLAAGRSTAILFGKKP